MDEQKRAPFAEIESALFSTERGLIPIPDMIAKLICDDYELTEDEKGRILVRAEYIMTLAQEISNLVTFG